MEKHHASAQSDTRSCQTASPGARRFLPEVVYLPRAKAVPAVYKGTPEGRVWVKRWRRLHLKTQPFTPDTADALSASIALIHSHAGYSPPERVFFELGDVCFHERVLLETACACPQSAKKPLTAAIT